MNERELPAGPVVDIRTTLGDIRIKFYDDTPKHRDNFLKLVNESGQSSFDYLQNLYSTSNVSEQGLPLGIAFTKQFLKGKGACRVHGGGFAGTIQCYIPTEQVAEYKKTIEAVFGKSSCHVLTIRPVGGYEVK